MALLLVAVVATLGAFRVGAAEIQGQGLPFTVFRAIGNPLFKDGAVGGFVDVTVEPGHQPGDWMATAIKVAEASITNGITFVEVIVVRENPRGARIPLAPIELARAYYSPIPGKSPWGNQWGITAAPYEATMPEIEYFWAYGAALDKYGERSTDPDKLDARARRDALAGVRAKYKLPPNWKSRDFYGAIGPERDKSDVEITGKADMTALVACLNKSRVSPVRMWGCEPD